MSVYGIGSRNLFLLPFLLLLSSNAADAVMTVGFDEKFLFLISRYIYHSSQQGKFLFIFFSFIKRQIEELLIF